MKKIVISESESPIEIASTMGCRTQNGADINAVDSYKENILSVINNGYVKDNIVSAAQKDGRGNICPVTIILPTLAMEAKEQVKAESKISRMIDCNDNYVIAFMQILDKKIAEAKDMLIERFDWICSQDAASAKFMYENNIMAGYIPEEGIRSALKHGTLAVG